VSARSLADLISAFGFVLYFSVYQLYADDAPPGEKLPFNTRVLLSSWRSASPHSLRGCFTFRWAAQAASDPRSGHRSWSHQTSTSRSRTTSPIARWLSLPTSSQTPPATLPQHCASLTTRARRIQIVAGPQEPASRARTYLSMDRQRVEPALHQVQIETTTRGSALRALTLPRLGSSTESPARPPASRQP
jgi:hypothetical protein